jgi:hypothetical protein
MFAGSDTRKSAVCGNKHAIFHEFARFASGAVAEMPHSSDNQ